MRQSLSIRPAAEGRDFHLALARIWWVLTFPDNQWEDARKRCSPKMGQFPFEVRNNDCHSERNVLGEMIALLMIELQRLQTQDGDDNCCSL